MMDKKGPSIAVILSGKKKAPEPPESDTDGDDYGGGDMGEQGREASQDFIDAVKAGDPDKLWGAFQALHRVDHAIMDKEDEGGEDEEKE